MTNKTLDQIQREAREEFDNFMIDEYGKWKIGRVETKSLLDSLIAQAYQLGRESLIQEEIERKKGMKIKEQMADWSKEHQKIGYNQAITEDITHLEELLKESNN